MGLDVYVGTLTRYVIGDWELITQRVAREAGVPFEIMRSEPEPDDAIRDPEVAREAVLEWRDALSRAVGADLVWAESDEMPYFTDKPDWSGYFGMLLLAAHDEHPDIPLPEHVPDRLDDHPLLKRVTTTPKRGLLRRSSEPVVPPRYFALYSAELWLPVDLEAVWGFPFVTGQEMTMSSTTTLRAQLRELARRLDADEADLARWRQEGVGGEVVETIEIGDNIIEKTEPASVEDEGRYGLAVFLDLAERAVEHRLPLKLDY